MRGDDRLHLPARHDRYDFETHALAAPMQDPFLQQAGILAAHELKAASETGLDPAIDIFQACRNPAALLFQMLINRHYIVAGKGLDHHEKHRFLLIRPAPILAFTGCLRHRHPTLARLAPCRCAPKKKCPTRKHWPCCRSPISLAMKACSPGSSLSAA